MRNRTTVALVLVTTWAMGARGGIVGDIVRVGYPSVGGLIEGRDMVRGGAWVPVIVDLSLDGPGSFDGWIRMSQPDKDGDLCFDTQKVQLSSDAGTRRYTLYLLPNPPSSRAGAYAVELRGSDNRRVALSSRGRRVDVLTPDQPPELLTANDFLVLSVSDRTAGKVALLQGPDLRDQFARSVRVAHVTPSELPSRWIGLDIADAVVWDEADPTQLTAAQLDALLEWTRQGGLLVVAAGRSSSAVAQSTPLSSMLPVEIDAVETATGFRKLRRNYLDLTPEDGDVSSKPITVARCSTRNGAATVLSEVFRSGDRASTVIARCRVDRGRVVFVAAALRDLLADSRGVRKFFQRVLELRSPNAGATVGPEMRLFDHMDHFVGFPQVGALYLGSAMIFAVIYVLVATIGSWQFLRHKGWLKHSWSAFAALAIVVNLVTVVVVQAVRGGVGSRLSQLSIVDADVGRSAAESTAYFGLKTSMFGRLDVWAPDDYPQVTTPSLSQCFLKPLPVSDTLRTEATYADPGRYQLAPSQAELMGVPIRGTVKQFEARWSGMMPGRLKADIRLISDVDERYDVRVAPGSSITNDLGVDLYQSFLIYAAQDVFIAGSANDISDRADKMYFFPVGPLADKQVVRPHDAFYRNRFQGPVEFKKWSEDHGLDNVLLQAADSFKTLSFSDFLGGGSQLSGLGSHEIALLLATLFAEYRPTANVNTFRRGSDLSFLADGLRHLDMSSLVDMDTALFLGFSRSAGPVRLCARSGDDDYESVIPSESMTMYRVLIPVTHR